MVQQERFEMKRQNDCELVQTGAQRAAYSERCAADSLVSAATSLGNVMGRR